MKNIWSTTTIQTYLARLVKKGILTTKRPEKGYLYYLVVSEKECKLAESSNFWHAFTTTPYHRW